MNTNKTTGFLTDSTLCIGCKACEVACKEWNDVDADGLNWTGLSYDNTGAVGHSTWRHVKFVEQHPRARHRRQRARPAFVGHSPPTSASTAKLPDASKPARPDPSCEPNSAASSAARHLQWMRLLRRRVPVRRRPEEHDDGRAFKCTFCYDRQKAGLKPACARHVQPNPSNLARSTKCKFALNGARQRTLHARGMADARFTTQLTPA